MASPVPLDDRLPQPVSWVSAHRMPNHTAWVFTVRCDSYGLSHHVQLILSDIDIKRGADPWFTAHRAVRLLLDGLGVAC
jgi:hypothetical protein